MMTKDAFLDLIQQAKFLELIGPCLRDDIVPYVFLPRPATWTTFRSELGTLLGVSATDITVIGSGRLGFSAKPGNNLARFRDKSDIDVVLVNADAFDELWCSLLSAAYPRPPMSDNLGGWLKKRRNEVYTGWLTPQGIHLDMTIYGEKARPVLEFRTRWFNALKRASRHPPRRHQDVTGRLYRSWRHAELYHLDSLVALGRSLTGEDPS